MHDAPDRTCSPGPSTSGAPDPRDAAPTPYGAGWLARQDPDLVRYTLQGFSDREVAGLPFLFDFWAHPHQLPPQGDWRTWVILGGRGAGKTRAGSEWVRSMVEGPRPRDAGRARRVALLAETLDQAREVMVFGDSGIMACSPPDRRPHWHATRRMLEWPNGATAQLFSAHEPEALRGPQFDAAWADELAKWKKGEETWDQLQFALRLGTDPRCVVTTTPRSAPALLALLDRPGTVTTHAPTRANRANLAPGFLDEVQRLYGGTRLGRQELDGVLMDDVDGALWTPALIDAARAAFAPRFDRVVVAVDPAVSTGKSSDSTGIVVVGAVTRGEVKDWRAFVLEDATVQGASPDEWGRAVVQASRRHGASRVIAEVNQGGAMVETILRQIDPNLPVTRVHAREGKGIRAEPVAALYEQGRVHHLAGADLRLLEDQMTRMTVTGYRGKGSPDRLDALVWAVHDSILAPSAQRRDPRIRGL
ncbi:DNA-packaging protein [Rubellimicrobium arenae]|uniref:DNA-packaging protein n=1 Tax=Rubellimicrobium arenae TaxID=2817372 RepID=UPI001B30FD57|nr:terminase family protein [Rubellimicrobium arenae]